MGKGDWYRKATWSLEDQKDFFDHLSRATGSSEKAEYLRKQAYCLQTQASPPNNEAALLLLEQLIKEFPDPAQIGLAYLQKAKCYEDMGQVDQALQAYREAVKLSKSGAGNYGTDAPLHFGIFVVKHRLIEHYNEVLESLEGTEPILLFPFARYMACATMSLIVDDTGMKDKAREYAVKALEVIGPDSSPPKDMDKGIHKRLVQVAIRSDSMPQ